MFAQYPRLSLPKETKIPWNQDLYICGFTGEHFDCLIVDVVEQKVKQSNSDARDRQRVERVEINHTARMTMRSRDVSRLFALTFLRFEV